MPFLRIPAAIAIAMMLFVPWIPARAKVEATPEGIRFTYTDPVAQTVFLAGNFNNWSTTANPMTRQGDVWSLVLPLEPGKYEYKFVVDGQWVADPENPVTVGEYGNSAFTVLSDGTLAAMRPTSNTALSSKIWMSGRAIGLYLFERNEQRGGRMELRRPLIDMDLDFRIRINPDLEAHVLANIDNEAENVEFYQTRLNFDRGSLTLDNPAVFLKVWDNEGILPWEDPLRLVGGVGIYDHRFGYGKMGAWARKRLWGFRADLLYADDEDTGGTDHPAVDTEALVASTAFTVGDDGNIRFSGPEAFRYLRFNTDAAEDVLAFRLERRLGRRWLVAGLYRLDRGYNPGSLAFLRADPADTTGTTGTLLAFPVTFERWEALGWHARYEHPTGLEAQAELLLGTAWVEGFHGSRQAVRVVTESGDPPQGRLEATGEAEALGSRRFRLDRSPRAWLGLVWPEGPGGADWRLSWELERHTQEPLATGLDERITNTMRVWRLGLERRWESLPLVGVPGEAGLDLESTDFSYDPDTPWEDHFWLDTRNFWLETGEHEVDFWRLTLLGGRDALVWRPRLRLRLEEANQVELAYRGRIAAQGWGPRPKYWESLLTAQGYVRPGWRLYLDARLVRYDDPVLEIREDFHALFVELAYQPREGVSVALSYGVDPFVVDEPVNEYAEIGRDQFLFRKGADARAAETNFRDLGRILARAERALQEERRIQVEAILRF
jgi:hypothetical protein